MERGRDKGTFLTAAIGLTRRMLASITKFEPCTKHMQWLLIEVDICFCCVFLFVVVLWEGVHDS